MRPQAYNYLNHLKNHMDLDKAFTGELIYPRQLQLYMPGGCNFRCIWCAGRYTHLKNIHWEEMGLRLLDALGDRIPYHQYTGCSTEPTINPYFLEFLKATKRNGCYFGIKTNGSQLLHLEEKKGFLTQLCDISTSFDDYISISLDAGCDVSHSMIKATARGCFDDIIQGIKLLCSIRGDRSYPAIRISYLMNRQNDFEVRDAIQIARDTGVDSIRFSQPHPAYFERDDKADIQWQSIATRDVEYVQLFDELASDTKPVVFYDSPFQKQDLYFNRCAYGYYQITLARDGFLYRCTTTVGVEEMRVGYISANLDDFEYAIKANQNESFCPSSCIESHTYCCRAAMAINGYYESELRKTD